MRWSLHHPEVLTIFWSILRTTGEKSHHFPAHYKHLTDWSRSYIVDVIVIPLHLIKFQRVPGFQGEPDCWPGVSVRWPSYKGIYVLVISKKKKQINTAISPSTCSSVNASSKVTGSNIWTGSRGWRTLWAGADTWLKLVKHLSAVATVQSCGTSSEMSRHLKSTLQEQAVK